MDIRPIRTKADYRAALKKVEKLWQAEPGIPAGDRVEVLVTLVEAYEAKHFAIPAPDPIAAIRNTLPAMRRAAAKLAERADECDDPIIAAELQRAASRCAQRARELQGLARSGWPLPDAMVRPRR